MCINVYLKQVSFTVCSICMRANESQQQANKKEWNEVYSSHPILWINVEITAYDDGKGEVLVRLRFRYKERK